MPTKLTIVDVDQAEDIADGDQLHNINCYEYLKIIADAIPDDTDVDAFRALHNFFKRTGDAYSPEIPYGNLYTDFLLSLEDPVNINKIKKTDPLNTPSVYKIINLIYANPNFALERSASMIFEVMNSNISHTSSDIESAVRNRLKGKSKTFQGKVLNQVNYLFGIRDLNATTPQEQGSYFGRLSGMLSDNFKPQTSTSLSSIRRYQYKIKANLPDEYRFGTQGQYHKKQARCSPLFELWLEMQSIMLSPENRLVRHVYFNNLALDRTDFEGLREKTLTEQLHDLENHYPIAVITLPADKGLMDKSLLTNHHQQIDIKDAFSDIFAIAIGESKRDIQDFYISDKIRAQLGFVDPHTELKRLLKESFEDLNFDDPEKTNRKISPAQMQAVFFHFIKFKLTDFILEKLNPQSFNISCKDAIDRGGVSSAYYNLMKSIQKGEPISKDEFHRALHAAPALVKGRGMNHHSKLIWNAIDAYLDAKSDTLNANLDWLKTWRNNNIPRNTKKYYFNMLNDYMIKRREDRRDYQSLFGTFNLETKLSAAEKLFALIQGKKNAPFTMAEMKALHNSDLGTIYKQLLKAGLFVEPNPSPSNPLRP